MPHHGEVDGHPAHVRFPPIADARRVGFQAPIRTGAYTAHCQPCDAWSPDWDLRGAAQDVELLYVMGRAIAADPKDWPDWKAGSEFKAIRAKSAPARR